MNSAPIAKYRKLWLSLIILGTEVLLYYLSYFYAYVVIGHDRYKAMDADIREMLIDATSVVICFLIAWLICRRQLRQAMHFLGLDHSPVRALLAAAICALPMFIGFGYFAGFQVASPAGYLIFSGLWAGFNEELVFRAFIAGLLVRKAGWHFIPAVFVSGLVFAMGHLYQASDPAEAWAIFGFTLLVNAGFFAFYKYSNWNIWFPIFLHGLMDAAFNIFPPAHNVLLNGPANVFRGITIGMAVAYVVVMEVRRQKKNATSKFPQF